MFHEFVKRSVFAMAADVSSSVPSKTWELCRVTSPALDTKKHWYVLTKSLCGSRPKDFAKNEIFCRFPSEIQLVETRELKPATSNCSYSKNTRSLYVATSFGLCAALLRQRDFPPDGFIGSSEFIAVQNVMNCIILDSDKEYGGKNSNFAARAKVVDAQITSWKAKFEAADLELIKLKTRVSDLEAEILALKSSSTSPYNCCTTTLLGDGSSPVSSCSSSSSIEDIKTSPLGSTTKKRKVAAHCRTIMTDLNDVCDKYNESLACVLGNCFLYGNEEDKKDVSNTVSEILNLVMDSKGTKKGIKDLLLAETHQLVLQSMRVPDWVLLYLKIQAKLPDAAWQTLLNLTQFGRSGVI